MRHEPAKVASFPAASSSCARRWFRCLIHLHPGDCCRCRELHPAAHKGDADALRMDIEPWCGSSWLEGGGGLGSCLDGTASHCDTASRPQSQ